MPNNDGDAFLLAQVRVAYGRVVYSHKAHEKQADLCFRKYRLQQTALVAFTAVSTGTFMVSLLGYVVSAHAASLATSFIALVVTALTLATKRFKFDQESAAHRDIAARLWDVRESYLSLIADLMSVATSAVDARSRRDELQEAARAVYAVAPRTTPKALRRATSGLKDHNEMTFTSREIDLYLPEVLGLHENED